MVLTLIIIFPLYRAIYALDLSQTSFLWIKNLAEPDILLVIINGIATLGQTYLTTKLSGNTMQEYNDNVDDANNDYSYQLSSGFLRESWFTG